jgi:hypothetical protein
MSKQIVPAGRRSRNRISSDLDRKLARYMAAAGAASVALLSTTQPAEAKIIHSITNIRVGFRPIEIDLNHDGVPDFVFRSCPRYHSSLFIVSPQVSGNAVQHIGGSNGAAPGFRGTPNGPGNSFRSNSAYCFSAASAVGVAMGTRFTYVYYSIVGPWVNTTNRYLGLKLVISGQIHYGWARLSINGVLTGRLTGYAYETEPNTQIIEGATSDIAALDAPDPLDQPVVPSFPSLGMLARGVEGLAIWRRDYTPVDIRRDDPIAG